MSFYVSWRETGSSVRQEDRTDGAGHVDASLTDITEQDIERVTESGVGAVPVWERLFFEVQGRESALGLLVVWREGGVIEVTISSYIDYLTIYIYIYIEREREEREEREREKERERNNLIHRSLPLCSSWFTEFSLLSNFIFLLSSHHIYPPIRLFFPPLPPIFLPHHSPCWE